MPKSKKRTNKKYTGDKKKNEQERLEREQLQEEQQNILTAEEGTTAADLERRFLNNEEFDVEEFQTKGERFINDNKGMVLGALGLFMLLAGLYFFFTRVYLPGQEQSAQNDMYQAQQYFEKDSFNLALNGDGNFPGFLEILDSYSGRTKSTNLANYYAGVSYLNTGDYQNAINYLGKFNGNDALLQGMAYGAMGDAYMELGDTDSGIAQYRKAAAHNPNELTTPMYLQRAGMALEQKGDINGAKEMYRKLKDYPKAQQSQEADKYLSRLEFAQ